MKTSITINTDFIKLEQALKLSALAETGGIAKAMIQDGIVSVNGEVSTQRGKKCRVGDKIEIAFEDELAIILVEG